MPRSDGDGKLAQINNGNFKLLEKNKIAVVKFSTDSRQH
jgi:hypothetical protein